MTKKREKKEHYINTYNSSYESSKIPFMKELFKSALKRVENDVDVDKVEAWVKKIEKLFFKLDI